MIRRVVLLRWLGPALFALAMAHVAGAQQALVVHVPSSPIEGAARQAAAAETLARLLSAEVDGLDLEAKLFRRLADAEAFLAGSPEQAVLMLTDAAWVPELPSHGLAPAFRLRRDGNDTYRRLLVVPADSGARNLGDLRGKSLTVVETTPLHDSFLDQAVFSGELSASDWFASTGREVDDFAAVNAALFGSTDAALAAEYNPLLAANLDRELRVVYRSPPLSLPVVSWRTSGAGALDAGTRQAIERAFTSLGGSAEGRALLGELGIEAFVAVGSAEAGDLASLPEADDKAYEITAPAGGVLRIDPPAPPRADALTFRLAIELPKVDVESGDDG